MIDIKNQRDIIIYGAGWVGKLVYDYLRIKRIGVSAFAVTKLQKDEMIDRIQVLALDDALRKYPNAYIILAVMPDKQEEMQNTLESKSVADYFILPEILFYEMRRVVLKYYAVNWMYDIKEGKGRLRIGYLYPRYFDTDVEILIPIENLLYNEAFIGIDDGGVKFRFQAGAIKNHLTVMDMLDIYKDMTFVNSDGSLNLSYKHVL